MTVATIILACLSITLTIIAIVRQRHLDRILNTPPTVIRTCPRCDGLGSITRGGSYGTPEFIPCPRCDGSGQTREVAA